MLTVSQAWERIAQHVAPVAPQRIPLAEALGTVLADDLLSPTDSPPFDKSMMDGFAVRAADLQASTSTLQVRETVFAGATASLAVTSGTAIRIMTGAPIPAGADTVIPVEWTTCSATPGGEQVSIQNKGTVGPGMNLLRRGHAMHSGELILKSGTVLRAQELALLAEIGESCPIVRRRPLVGVLATGDELVECDQQPGPGQIRNSNALMLAAQVEQAGAIPRNLGIARDNVHDLKQAITAGLECDFLCLSGGVSAGQADLVPQELQSAGVVEIFHKVAMKPGKPIWFGSRPGQGGAGPCFVFGLPGNPVSSMVCFELFVRMALRHFSGIRPAGPRLSSGQLQVPFEHRGDRPTWFPAMASVEQGTVCVRPVNWKGSADLRSMVDANCSLSIPVGDVSWKAGTVVEILPWGTGLSALGSSVCQRVEEREPKPGNRG